MSKFRNIESKLENFAFNLSAKYSKNRPHYPNELINFEERRLDWKAEEINKSIIIQPVFEANGVNQKLWNFYNFAWIDEFDGQGKRPVFKKILVEKERFESIEINIDSLLNLSLENLSSLKRQDLKY